MSLEEQILKMLHWEFGVDEGHTPYHEIKKIFRELLEDLPTSDGYQDGCYDEMGSQGAYCCDFEDWLKRWFGVTHKRRGDTS